MMSPSGIILAHPLKLYSYEMCRQMEKVAALRDIRLLKGRGTILTVSEAIRQGRGRGAYAFFDVPQEDRELDIFDFSRRYLQPQAYALVTALHAAAGKEIYTAPLLPYEVDIQCIPEDIPIGLGFGISADRMNPLNMVWSFGIEYWWEEEKA